MRRNNMDFLKELFGENALTFEQFSEAVTGKGIKLADLATGNYVAKKKYEDEIATKDSSISDLSKQLKDRDKDLKTLQAQLSDGSKDSETKITELTEKLTSLQSDYENTKNEYKEKLNAQAYDFATKEFANGLKFTSEAAKRDFINEMRSAKLQVKDNSIIGANDFYEMYKTKNTDAFVVEEEKKPEEKKPTFIQPTAPGSNGDADIDPFLTAFGFSTK